MKIIFLLALYYVVMVEIKQLDACMTNTVYVTQPYFPPNSKAIAILSQPFGNTTLFGSIKFFQAAINTSLYINVSIIGLPPNTKHGLHVHNFAIGVYNASVAQTCGSSGGHFNPLNTSHGNISSNNTSRHIGDYGNIVSDQNGLVNMTLVDNISQLYGPYGIIGRTITLHLNEDDLGRFNNTLSQTIGNSGPRIACGIIGIAPT